MKEFWKDVVGYEGLYSVSSKGRIKTHSWERTGKSRILKQRANPGGYLGVCLYKNGVVKSVMSHRIVASAFLPNPNNLPCVNHKNEKKSDNRVENLEWCTYGYNNSYNGKGYRVRQSVKKNGCIYGGLPVYQCLLDGTIVKRFDSMNQARIATGIRHISECCKGGTRYATAGGYMWRYAE